MRLAWQNIAHERTRFLVTILGIACATLLMITQGSILMGFLGAASKIIDATDSDLWIAGRGASCFEFPVVLERRFVELAHSVSGVESTTRILTRIVEFRKSDGNQQLVTLIGAERGAGSRFPAPHIGNGAASDPDSILIDESSSGLLIQSGGLSSAQSGGLPSAVEINEHRANVTGRTSGFSSFLGTPYVFSSYTDGLRYTGMRPTETMFILVRVRSGASIADVKRQLMTRLPNVDVWTKKEFARKAQMYWSSQTGAGGAILAAALLGFIIGLAVVSQAIYATTMEHIEEFATLKAIGATHGFVIRVIVTQALVCGIAGYLLGIALSEPVIRQAKSAIPWLSTPAWLPLAILPPALAICMFASVLSVRAALAVEPARVFRA
ncbi:MAG: FtsX-like permease family protein [Bryobacteraceae bacterium]